MEQNQLRRLILDALKELDDLIQWSYDAAELLMLTAAQESELGKYVEQIGGGPALGIFQMEPATETDIWDNYLAYRPSLAGRVKSIMIPGVCNLKYNLLYQIWMARIHYYRVPEVIPARRCVSEMARYYKKYYNTKAGKATIQQAVATYFRLRLDETK